MTAADSIMLDERGGPPEPPHSTATSYPSRTPTEPAPVARREPVVWGGPEDGPLDGDLLDDFDRRGYTVRQSLVSPDEVAEITEDVRRVADDPALVADERVIREPTNDSVRSVFEIHRLSPVVARLAADDRIAGVARQLLGSDVYLHQSRVNFKPGFRGSDFYWHSDFETWHMEDGLPRMRTVSASISLTDNLPYNGSLMIIPGSHHTFVGCAGPTPDEHYRQSLRQQRCGVPSDAALGRLVAAHGIEMIVGPAGTTLFFDANCMHGSNTNITPMPRSNVFLVFNSVENAPVAPFGATRPRPTFVASRTVTPL